MGFCPHGEIISYPNVQPISGGQVPSSSQQAAAKGLSNGLTKKPKRGKDKESAPEQKEPES